MAKQSDEGMSMASNGKQDRYEWATWLNGRKTTIVFDEDYNGKRGVNARDSKGIRRTDDKTPLEASQGMVSYAKEQAKRRGCKVEVCIIMDGKAVEMRAYREQPGDMIPVKPNHKSK